MPNVMISVYMNDDEYTKYFKNAANIRKIARDCIKKELTAKPEEHEEEG